MSEYHYTNCKWLPANHFLFQIANVCLAASYLAPNTLNGLFMLRGALGLGGLFFALWGWWILCAPDTFIWNVLFMVFNFGHLAYLTYKVKKPRRFSAEAECVFKHFFGPLGVERFQFQKLAKTSSILKLSAGEVYGREESPADRVSVLLTGRIKALKGGTLLHVMKEFEFVDSPEWATFRPGTISRYGVSLVAGEDCTFMTWDASMLRNTLGKDHFLKNVFNSLIGQDVTNKLLHLDRNFEASLETESSAIVYEKHERAASMLNAKSAGNDLGIPLTPTTDMGGVTSICLTTDPTKI